MLLWLSWWAQDLSLSAQLLRSPMALATRPPLRMRTENTTTRRAIRRSKYRATGQWIGLLIQVSAAIIHCHVCHGPDGEGSSYAPALSNSLKTMNYPDFANVVVNGRKNVNTAQESVMPAFGMNPNVMCYLDDLFVYLRARANGAVPRGRPQKHEEKPEAATQAETSCLGHKS